MCKICVLIKKHENFIEHSQELSTKTLMPYKFYFQKPPTLKKKFYSRLKRTYTKKKYSLNHFGPK